MGGARGNPALAIELCRAGDSATSASYEALIASQLAALEAPAREILQLLAVAQLPIPETELAHLAEPGHGAAFRELEARFPHAERAKGFLEAMGFGMAAEEYHAD